MQNSIPAFCALKADRKVMSTNCYTCVHRKEIPFSAHSTCLFFWKNKKNPTVEPLQFKQYGKDNGWFDFPYDYDPVWITSQCPHHVEKLPPPPPSKL